MSESPGTQTGRGSNIAGCFLNLFSAFGYLSLSAGLLFIAMMVLPRSTIAGMVWLFFASVSGLGFAAPVWNAGRQTSDDPPADDGP